MIKYLLLFLLAAPAAQAQSTDNNTITRKIDRIVKQVQADTTLVRVTKTDSLARAQRSPIMRQRQAVSYFRDSSVVRYQVGRFDGPYLSGFSRDYYFQDDKLIYLSEEISNSSRMGSCGTVTVKYDYYLKDGELIYFRRGQPHDFYETCYGNMGPKDVEGIKEALEADREVYK
ncbi:cupin domain-containing protein [Ferruginibacter sp. HRS2-29]|uniref:cupin domain-containing protein n=1 Tax=Ferruginibacter sp. HRS2-29 TaxID=2487334 RepID=UPI0020CE3414|nr:cupin domain-containing protein [Ferruginibacter sp. HRS2-29]MCP9751603.1 hypothetical protein [Ferruginibacter sp. HRS2-29]